MDTLYVDNDHMVEVRGLRDASGKLLSAANVQTTLYEADGVTEVGGQVWPLTLSPDPESAGRYRAALPPSLEVVDGQRCKLRISAEFGGKAYSVVRTVNVEERYR